MNSSETFSTECWLYECNDIFIFPFSIHFWEYGQKKRMILLENEEDPV